MKTAIKYLGLILLALAPFGLLIGAVLVWFLFDVLGGAR